MTRSILAAAAALAMFAVATASAHAAASNLDACILDITFQCVDSDQDFWECYGVGVELCENQSSAVIALLPPSQLTAIKKQARQQAQAILQRSHAKR